MQDPGGVCVLLLGNWRVMTPWTPQLAEIGDGELGCAVT